MQGRGLTDFGSVAFSGATADGGRRLRGLTEHQITMTKNKKGTIVKASTSALVGGAGFTVTWVSSEPADPYPPGPATYPPAQHHYPPTGKPPA